MTHTFDIDQLFNKIESAIDVKLEAFLYSYYFPLKIKDKNALMPPEQLFNAKKNEMKKALKEANKQLDRFKEAVHLFNEHKEEFLSAEEKKHFDREMEEFQERFVNFNPDKSLLEKSHSIKEILGISDFVLYCYYLVGYNLFQKGHFQQASPLFFFIAVLNPLVKDYWLSLGIAEQENKQYEQAIYALRTASLLDKTDPRASLLSAQNFIALKDIANAKAQLSSAKEIIKERKLSDFSELVSKLELDINQLK